GEGGGGGGWAWDGGRGVGGGWGVKEERVRGAAVEPQLDLLVVDGLAAQRAAQRQLGEWHRTAVAERPVGRLRVFGRRERRVGADRQPHQREAVRVAGHVIGVGVVGEPDRGR